MTWADLSLSEDRGTLSALSPCLQAGVYDDGLVTLPTSEDAQALTEALEWSFEPELSVVGYNAFGDLFMRTPGHSAICYLWLQYGKGRPVAADVDGLASLLTAVPADREKFLETRAFRVARERLGPLRYGQVYTHAPILALGGTGDPASCHKGRLDAYLSIVSQTF